KFVAHIEAGQSPPSDLVTDGSDGLLFLQGNADFGPVSPMPRQVCDSAPKRALPGDILLSVRAPVGAMNVADQDYGIGRGLCAIRLGPMADLRYGFHALSTTRRLLDSVATGSTYDAVTTSHVGDLPQLLPSVPEQRAIAAFLDRETARIDALVAKKERLIELLQEKRTALITRAVTKGLDPTVPMKDSGVEWLGQIPAHWEVQPLRWALSVRSGEALDNSEFELTQEEGLEVAVIGGNGVMGYTNRANTDTACIAIGRVGALCGNVHLVEPPAWITDNALVASGIRGFDRWYLALLLRVLDLNRWATQNAQPLITGGFVKAQRVCAPPDAEQRAIAVFLDRETARIDALIAKVCKGIEKLKEYRIALISAAVTGKIDVREAVSGAEATG